MLGGQCRRRRYDMKVVLLLVLAAAALLAEAAPQVPVPKKKPQLKTLQHRDVNGGGGGTQLRVIHGHAAAANQFPWQVGIQMDKVFFCGGSVIGSTVVLTAAQCALGYSQYLVNVGDSTRQFHFGDSYEYAYTYKTVVHEDYQEDLRLNDIGLVLLLAPLALTDAVKPIGLPTAADKDRSLVGLTATISGWGTDDSGSISYQLKYTTQPIMDEVRCVRFFGNNDNTGLPLVREDVHICADGEGGASACGDDLGGPLVIQEEDGTWKQVGISSFESDMGCVRGYPSVYTRVSAFVDWVGKYMPAAPATDSPSTTAAP